MKKLISVLLSLITISLFAVTSLAANPAKFKLNLVEETNNQIIVTLDYIGGLSFNGIDFEVKYNAKKLKATSAYDGEGLSNFVKETKKTGNLCISAINPDTNPMKGSIATLTGFKAVNGKDLFIMEFKKLTKDKVANGDIVVKFSNCTDENTKSIIPSMDNNFTTVGTTAEVTTMIKTTTSPLAKEPDETTTTTVEAETTETTTAATTAKASPAEILSEDDATTTEPVASEDNGSSINGKIIIIIAICVVLVAAIAVTCIVVAKKCKKNGEE